jgi:ABC-type glycerol-3-phosphate transport system substrate-binding protein
MKKSRRAVVLAVAALAVAFAAEGSPARSKTLEVTYYYLPG